MSCSLWDSNSYHVHSQIVVHPERRRNAPLWQHCMERGCHVLFRLFFNGVLSPHLLEIGGILITALSLCGGNLSSSLSLRALGRYLATSFVQFDTGNWQWLMKVRRPVSPSLLIHTRLQFPIFLMEEQTLLLILISLLILPAGYLNLASKLKVIVADTTFCVLTRFT